MDIQKYINLEKMKQKQEGAETEHGHRREISRNLDINFIALIDRDSGLIKKFKIMSALLHNSQVNLSEQKRNVYRERILGAKKLMMQQ
jgi:hypothetical protein